MKVAIDNTVLTLLLNPEAKAAHDPATKQPTQHLRQKLLSLIHELTLANATMILPTPALAETLCVAQPTNELIKKISSYSCIETYPFDQKAAITLSELVKRHRSDIKQIRDDATKPWQHLKMDMQIVAVAVTYQADVIYTDDKSQGQFAELGGLQVKRTWDLTISDKFRQTELFEPSS